MNSAKLALFTNKLSPKVSRFVGRKGLVIKKQSPNILFGVGIVGTVASTVLACRSTLKLSQTLDDIEKDISQARGIESDVTYAYVRGGVKLGRLYGPAVGVGLVSIGCLSKSHVDLTRRNASLVAAYATLQGAFDSYRDRVRDDIGADRELDIYSGVIDTRVDKEGQVEKLHDPNARSPYARFFDEYSSHYEKNAELNRLYIQCQQNYANELLRARGHVFLNEVYDMLGIDRSQAGAVVGWVVGDTGDNYIDFGMYANTNSRFINGWEPSILLDFNVDGVIYDKI